MLVALSEHPGFAATKNEVATYIGAPYLYLGFVPSATAEAKSVLGIKANGGD